MTDLEKHLQEIKSRIAAYFDCEGAKTIGACFWDLTALVVIRDKEVIAGKSLKNLKAIIL
ncbi:hypothetical protein BMS3Bbin03_01204 [bacterium BMS3Bbin03]|nr:hypothetical protein BMS3Bbin03_01204 [bacterium BMS3Bbin03]